MLLFCRCACAGAASVPARIRAAEAVVVNSRVTCPPPRNSCRSAFPPGWNETPLSTSWICSQASSIAVASRRSDSLVLSARTTSSTCPACSASTDAGEAASAGGESKITMRRGLACAQPVEDRARAVARQQLGVAARARARGSTESWGMSVSMMQSSTCEIPPRARRAGRGRSGCRAARARRAWRNRHRRAGSRRPSRPPSKARG